MRQHVWELTWCGAPSTKHTVVSKHSEFRWSSWGFEILDSSCVLRQIYTKYHVLSVWDSEWSTSKWTKTWLETLITCFHCEFRAPNSRWLGQVQRDQRTRHQRVWPGPWRRQKRHHSGGPSCPRWSNYEEFLIFLFACPLRLFKTFHSASRTEFPEDNSDQTLLYDIACSVYRQCLGYPELFQVVWPRRLYICIYIYTYVFYIDILHCKRFNTSHCVDCVVVFSSNCTFCTQILYPIWSMDSVWWCSLLFFSPCMLVKRGWWGFTMDSQTCSTSPGRMEVFDQPRQMAGFMEGRRHHHTFSAQCMQILVRCT